MVKASKQAATKVLLWATRETKVDHSPAVWVTKAVWADHKVVLNAVQAVWVTKAKELADHKVVLSQVTWAKTHNIPDCETGSLIQNPKVREHYKAIVDELNKHFNNVEQVKKFELLSSPFSLEKGEITPGLGKLRRKVIMESREEDVRRIYS